MSRIVFTPTEALYLSDNISLTMECPEELSPCIQNLLVKICGVIVEQEKAGPEACAAFSLEELLLLRECVNSLDSYGSDRVGVQLLRKIASAIMEKAAEDAIGSAIALCAGSQSIEN